jgi:hypothetical protein
MAEHADMQDGAAREHPADDDRRGPLRPDRDGRDVHVVKIREGIASYADPGWYDHPEGTVAAKVDEAPEGLAGWGEEAGS